MKKFLFFLIFISQFLILGSSAQSPNWLWAKSMGGTSFESGTSTIDAFGNVYTTGDFRGTVDFDPGAGIFNLTSNGGRDIFISKLDSSGNFVWAKAVGGINDDAAFSIAIDPAGSGAVYTTGFFHGTDDFDPGVGVFNLTSSGSYDIFISKLDGSGNFVWAKAIGGTGDDLSYSIAFDPLGNGGVYTTGRFNGTVDFDPGVGVYNLTGTFNGMFISKLDSLGNFIWAKAMGGTNDPSGFSIALDTAGSRNVYIVGWFYGTVDFDPGMGTFNLTSVGPGYNTFILKSDSLGNFIWAKAMGGTDEVYGRSIAFDAAGSGNVYTTGYFGGTVDFDPGAGVFNLTSAGFEDIFISKLDSSGNFVWAKAMGGTDSDGGSDITPDPAGSGGVYTTGSFRGTTDLDPGAGVFNLTSAGFGDSFISKLDSSGNFVWAKAAGGTSNDEGNSINLDANGKVYMTGEFGNPTITFGTTTLTNAGNTDIFIVKLDTAIVTGINETAYFGMDMLLYPNPVSNSTMISFSISQSQNVSLKIFDLNGRLVAILAEGTFSQGDHQIVWNAGDVEDGMYLLQFQSSGILQTEKVIVTNK